MPPRCLAHWQQFRSKILENQEFLFGRNCGYRRLYGPVKLGVN